MPLKAQSWLSANRVETRYDLSKADVIVSLDADFLYAGFPGNVRYVRDFASKRNPDAEMSRLYVVESTPSSTGAKADHRLPLRAVEIEGFARALASAIGVNVGGALRLRRHGKVCERRCRRFAEASRAPASSLPAIINRPQFTPWPTP